MNYYRMTQVKPAFFEPDNQVQSQLAWWVKIITAIPYCIYYFGPFDSEAEATVAQYGYIEDLRHENASGIDIEIEQSEPKELTITNDFSF
ncbi:MAG TPA: DUF1816 domain-containing protein [Xenococcaceae cyanobacterium]